MEVHPKRWSELIVERWIFLLILRGLHRDYAANEHELQEINFNLVRRVPTGTGPAVCATGRIPHGTSSSYQDRRIRISKLL